METILNVHQAGFGFIGWFIIFGVIFFVINMLKKKKITKIILVNKMLKKINKEYLVSLDFSPVIEDGKEYLKKEYLEVYLFNKKNEIIDAVEISIYLEEHNNKWIISKCISLDNKKEDVFDIHFKSNKIKELLSFDRYHLSIFK